MGIPLVFPPGELLSTINFVLPPQLFSFSLVTIIGCLLLVISLSYYVWQCCIKKKSFHFFRILVILMLPLNLFWFYSQLVASVQAFTQLGKTEVEQLKNRACDIDTNQSFGNVFCNLPSFIQIIYRDVPLGSTLFLTESGVKPFLEYQLSSDYYITKEIQSADYIVIYFSESSLNYDKEGNLYQSGRDEKGEVSRMLIGKYEIFTFFDQEVLIFKKRP